MKKPQCGVYKIQSPCGGIYIGSTYHMTKRIAEHRAMLRAGRHHSKGLQAASDRYGMDSLVYEIIIECPRGELRDREQEALDRLEPEFNRSKDSRQSLSTLWQDPEFRARNTERARQLNAVQNADPNFIARQRERVKNMHTPEAIEKSTAAKRKKWAEDPEYAARMREKSSNQFKSMHADPEFRKRHAERMSGVLRERSKDPEFIEKRNQAVAKALNKPVQCVETGQIFESIKAAGEWSKIPSYRNIGSAASGKIKSCGGYHWRFVDGDQT